MVGHEQLPDTAGADPAAPDPISHVDLDATVDVSRLVHTTYPGGATARCGNLGGPLVPWERVTDPDDDATFDCPDCWLSCSGGAEPMGGGG